MPTFLTPLVQPMLEQSVQNNAVMKARFAILMGADPNAMMQTPLLCQVAAMGRLELVKALIKGGAKLTAKDADGDTPLMAALRGMDIETKAPVKKKGKPAGKDTLEGKATAKAKAWTPAVANSSKKSADKTTTWVLDDGGNIADKGGQRGQRRLPPAAPSVVEAATSAGASPNATSTGGSTYRQTPLMLASQWGNPAIVRTLIIAGGNVNAFDSDGETVLMYAAAEGVADVVKALLSKGANVNAQNTAGATALHIAAQYNRANAVTILLASGADLSIRNHKGLAATDIAVAMRSIAAAKAIVAATTGRAPAPAASRPPSA